LRVPAHVPIERVRFAVDPAFRHDFARTVSIGAKPDVNGSNAVGAAEAVQGVIERVERAGDSLGRGAIHSEQMSVEAELASNMSAPALITIQVDNGDDAPLPLASAKLEMRERKVCFDAEPDAAYTLRYGDSAPLRAPVYDYARLFRASASAAVATMGPEQANPEFRERVDDRPYTERHPELLWVVMLGVIAVLGMVAMRSARRAVRR
jgi:hypothetical protein